MTASATEIVPDLKVYVRPRNEPSTAKATRVVGTVDHLEGKNFIKLKKSDSIDGQHHWIPLEWVEKIERGSIILNKDEDEFRAWAMDDNPIAS